MQFQASKSSRSSLPLSLLCVSAVGFLHAAPPPPNPITITTVALPAATVGQPYSVQLTAKGGSGTFGWCYTLGTQKTCDAKNKPLATSVTYQGLTFDFSGAITGTPTATQTLNFSVYAENPNTHTNLSDTSSFTIPVNTCTATITPAPSTHLPQAQTDVPYSAIQFKASGCGGSFTLSLTSIPPNAFPSGLTFQQNTGTLSGTPTATGAFSLVLTATDSSGNVSPAGYTLNVVPGPTAITITTSALPAATVAQPYVDENGNTVQLQAQGGSGAYAWCYTLGSRTTCAGPGTDPAASTTYEGLTFNSDGTITGTPTTLEQIQFSVYAENNVTHKNLSPSKSFTISVNTCTAMVAPDSTDPLPQAEVGVPYAAIQFTASGCNASSFIYSLTSTGEDPLPANAFPTGLNFQQSSGVLMGTPTLAGTFDLVVTAVDSFGDNTPTPYTLTVIPAPSVTTTSPLPAGVVSVPYSQTIAVAGGTPPYTFSMNAEPPGIVNIDPVQGTIHGTPTTAGTYNFNVGVTDSLGAQVTAPFQVTFAVVASQVQITPLSLPFTAGLNGSAPPPQALSLVPTNAATPPVSYSVVVDAGQTGSAAPSWLSVSATTGSAPAGLAVTVNQGTLAEGKYTGRILIMDPIGVPTAIPVTLNVTNIPQQLTVAPAMLNFTAVASAPGTITQNVLVSSTGAGSLGFNTSVIGGSSLISSLTSNASQTSLNAPAVLQVGVSTNGLPVGAYHDTIQISSAAGTVQVPVSLFIASGGPVLAVNTTGVSFQAFAADGSTATQNIEILDRGDSNSRVNWTASLLTGSNWLSLSTPAGTTLSGSATTTAPGILTLALAPSANQLDPGNYYALIAITDSNSLNSPQYVTAVLNLQPSAGDPPPGLTPAGLFFTTAAGGLAPAAQTVQISNSSADAVPFAASANGGSWLSIDTNSGTVSGKTSGTVNVSVDPAGLAAGLYTGQVSVSVAGSLQSVNVTFVVQNSGANTSSTTGSQPHTSACTPSQVAATETGLANNYQVPQGSPQTLMVQLNDDCGNPISNGNVVASFSNGDTPIALTPDGIGNYSATWLPIAANSNMVISFNANSGKLQSTSTQLFGAVLGNSPFPALSPGGTLNNFNPVLAAPLAPGTITQVYGSHLATSNASPNVLPLPTIFNNTSALVGANKAPLFYLSSGQVNLLIPTDTVPNQQLPLVLNVNGAYTLPVTVDIVPAAPGVLSANDGPNPPSVQNGAHLVAQHASDFSMVSSSNPAKPGETLVMYLVGMGATNPPVASGAASPSATLAIVTNQPAVSVGSQPATVSFAGLTPGFVGLYQINFEVPQSASAGELQVTVTQNGVAANPTVLPVAAN